MVNTKTNRKLVLIEPKWLECCYVPCVSSTERCLICLAIPHWDKAFEHWLNTRKLVGSSSAVASWGNSEGGGGKLCSGKNLVGHKFGPTPLFSRKHLFATCFRVYSRLPTHPISSTHCSPSGGKVEFDPQHTHTPSSPQQNIQCCSVANWEYFINIPVILASYTNLNPLEIENSSCARVCPNHVEAYR